MNSVAIPVATQMLFHNRPRFIMTVVGIAIAFFLAAAQIGLLVGWINTNSAIIKHAGVDIWVMAQETRTLDYGTAIPRHRIQQVSSVQGVAWAEGMLVGWVNWQHPEGKHITVEVIGLDKANAGGPWLMPEGNISSIHLPQTVVVDELSKQTLGVRQIGDEAEMEGRRVIIGGFSRGVRTFTASPFVFTSIDNALDYVAYYQDDEISYVLVRIDPGADVMQVRDRIAREVSHVEVLTTAEFAERSVKYWMLETGVGITVIITAALGLLVGAVIMSQTLFAITQDHIANYATLLALGFHQKTLRQIVLTQSLSLGGLGIVVGSVLFFIACNASATTPIPLETTPMVSTSLILFSLLCCIASSWFSIRAIFKLDPVMVFHG
ncbi:ABC transporter permease [Methylomonas sp. SURF-2]|uniref:ABC transporter permease n=1 Tax=Methylomonas subterranea TaxID=2952225 RepID=A0ABT1TJA4_9GAMM|nr:ABC transporter permease [Methylomonas sp. SURF-2]MCQ8105137.1 ABC transporter permease [Methylomonas sp. SURF-2]